MKILIFIGFLMEFLSFMMAGASAVIDNHLFYYIFLFDGFLLAWIVGKAIGDDAIENYKRKKK
jgi:hypothetical protein